MPKISKEEYMILSALEYQITDEDTGEINEGISIWCLPQTDLEPFEDTFNSRAGFMNPKGYKPMKINIPREKRDIFISVPGIYEVSYTMTVANNRPTPRIMDMKFKREIKIKEEPEIKEEVETKDKAKTK